MRGASLRYGAEVLGVDSAVQILVDENAHARCLPGAQAADQARLLDVRTFGVKRTRYAQSEFFRV
jgi:hypothetical protein